MQAKAEGVSLTDIEEEFNVGRRTAERMRDAIGRLIPEMYEADTGERILENHAEPSDAMELFVFGNEGGWHARLVARLDNLGKGASGAAVQNLNLMCGLPETSGLVLPAA